MIYLESPPALCEYIYIYLKAVKSDSRPPLQLLFYLSIVLSPSKALITQGVSSDKQNIQNSSTRY